MINFYKTRKHSKNKHAPTRQLFFIARALLAILVFSAFCLGISNLENNSFGNSAYAQMQTNTNKNEPLEITADDSLEWRRNESLFIARKNALAVQGDVSVSAAILTANYRDGDKNGFEIYRVTANTNAIINSDGSKAYGDDVTYNLDDGLAVMTGNNLRLITTEQTITARDRFEYWVPQGKLIAIGNAKIVRPTDTLEADIITAILKENDKGERVLETLEAEGRVVITTQTEVLTGNYGIYRASTNKAEVTGNVIAKKGKNILQGERAEIDLNTNVSKIFGVDGSNRGRVRGVFYPENKKEETQNN